MIKAKNIFLLFPMMFSSQLQASYLNLTTETNGSLGPSISHSVDGINLEISAYNYDVTTGNVQTGLVAGIDGLANVRHPAGIGAAKSNVSFNPPGIDNTDPSQIEFLLFKFDQSVSVTAVETTGLGPHGSDVNYWGGNTMGGMSNISDLGVMYTLDDTTPFFTPSNLSVISWLAIGAKPEEDFNVFSIQGIQFNPAPVPVPAAFWLLGSGLIGLAARRKAMA